ncbi:MAG: D-glucuronyl C5-epimerase family protein [Calditrichia bacterium]
MLRKFYIDVTRDKTIYRLADDIHSPELGEYYFIITEEMMLSGHSQQFSFDEEGIPIIPSYIDVSDQKMVYYPISIGQYGLAIWNSYLKSRSQNDKARFLKIADWFLQNRRQDLNLGAYWLTDVDKPAYNVHEPWKSAFSQARAINLLMRAFQLTGKKEYEAVSRKALQPFLRTVSEGGVTVRTEFGPFYEEYPAAVPVLVLNGIIFSLCGVYDFIRTHPQDEISRRIFEEGVQTLKGLLPQYDMGFWSKYSLCQADFHPQVDPATISYHHLHIIQLEFMHRLTGEPIFREYAARWRGYANWRNILRMYRIKYKALRKMNRL